MKRIIALFTLATAIFTFSANCRADDKGKTIELNKKTFLEKVADYEINPDTWKYLGKKPAIVDFYATWCMPCKRLAPVLEELAKDYADDIVVYKVDAEREREVSSVFGIRSFPTLIFIPMDGNPQVLTGAYPKEELIKIIDKVLLKK